MPWYFYLALKQLFPTGRRFPFFTFMSGLGVAVGVTLLVVSTSIMGGFGHEIRRMIVDTQGEIQVVAAGAIDDPDEVIAQIQQVPGVVGATPSAQGVVALIYENKPVYPAIQGVDLERVETVVALERYIHIGSLDDLDDDSVILSSQLAYSLGVSIGSRVEIYSPLLLLNLGGGDQIILPREVRVAGIFEIGHQQLDRSLIICSLRLMQELYDLGDAVHAINVRLAPGVDEFRTAAALNALLPPQRRALTWFESNADFQSIIRFEKYMVFFLLAFIVVVAALSIMSSLLIAVVRKTREIGLLGALGGRSRDVAACFCLQGFFLGITGTAAGLLMAWFVITFRDEIVQVLAGLTVGQEVFQQFYQFAQLPAYTSGFDLTIIIVGSIVVSTLAGLIPAWRAARLKPVEALRSE